MSRLQVQRRATRIHRQHVYMMHEPGTHMTEWSQQRRSLEQRPGTMPTTPTHSSPPRRIFKYEFVASLPLSPSVKEFGKSVDIWGSYAQEFSVLFFLTHSVDARQSLSVARLAFPLAAC